VRLARGRLALMAVVAAVTAYARVYRPWQLRWGATDAEVSRVLPGDELVASPWFDSTRAITIAAPPQLVWPWLVQVGVSRAGWYSYDLLDNLGRPSARRVIDELQDIQPGDLLPMSPDGKHGIRVHALDPPHWMIWGTPGDTSWVWVLDQQPDGTTRLLTRVRSKPHTRPSSYVFAVLLEFADFPMMRRMLLNLRLRSEHAASPEPPDGSPPGPVGHHPVTNGRTIEVDA
jgi:hypothetical protein